MDEAGWFADLACATEPDGIRLLGHRFAKPGVSEFLVSSRPEVPPVKIVQRVKGRLQHLVRSDLPKALKGNYAIRSVGQVTRETVERYVAGQVEHHTFADERFTARLAQFQFEDASVRLDDPAWTSHGCYWFNLHIVLVHRDRWAETRDEVLGAVRDMILRSSAAKKFRLSRAGILPEHIHLVLGCPIDASPAQVALGFLNNLAFVHGMRAVFQFGAFVGTTGEYTNHVVQLDVTRRSIEACA
jgi:REP element-mobilizing transposase RayT